MSSVNQIGPNIQLLQSAQANEAKVVEKSSLESIEESLIEEPQAMSMSELIKKARDLRKETTKAVESFKKMKEEISSFNSMQDPLNELENSKSDNFIEDLRKTIKGMNEEVQEIKNITNDIELVSTKPLEKLKLEKIAIEIIDFSNNELIGFYRTHSREQVEEKIEQFYNRDCLPVSMIVSHNNENAAARDNKCALQKQFDRLIKVDRNLNDLTTHLAVGTLNPMEKEEYDDRTIAFVGLKHLLMNDIQITEKVIDQIIEKSTLLDKKEREALIISEFKQNSPFKISLSPQNRIRVIDRGVDITLSTDSINMYKSSLLQLAQLYPLQPGEKIGAIITELPKVYRVMVRRKDEDCFCLANEESNNYEVVGLNPASDAPEPYDFKDDALKLSSKKIYQSNLLEIADVKDLELGKSLEVQIMENPQTYSVMIRRKEEHLFSNKARESEKYEVVVFDSHGYYDLSDQNNAFASSMTFENIDKAVDFLAFHRTLSIAANKNENTVEILPLKLKQVQQTLPQTAKFAEELQSLDLAFKAIENGNFANFNTELATLNRLSEGVVAGRIRYYLYFQHLTSRPQIHKDINYGNNALYGENGIAKASNEEIKEAVNRARIEIVLSNLLNTIEMDDFDKVRKYLSLFEQVDKNKYNSLKGELWNLCHEDQESKNLNHPDFGGKAFANEEYCSAAKRLKKQAIENLIKTLAREWGVGQTPAEFKKYS